MIMKKKLILLLVVLMGSMNLFAQDKKEILFPLIFDMQDKEA